MEKGYRATELDACTIWDRREADNPLVTYLTRHRNTGLWAALYVAGPDKDGACTSTRTLFDRQVQHLLNQCNGRTVVVGDVLPRFHVLTGVQGIRAWRLAWAHGHLWAEALKHELGGAVEQEILDMGIPFTRIGEIAQAFWDDVWAWSGVPGIEYPTLERGVIRHRTSSGRTRWVISPDGSVGITISRPCGDVLWGVVDPEGVWKVGVLGDADYIRHYVRWRHVHTLADVIADVLTQPGDYQAHDEVVAWVKNEFPDVPRHPAEEFGDDLMEVVRSHMTPWREPIRITIETGPEGWSLIDVSLIEGEG